MGSAKRRGTYDERVAQAISAGRVLRRPVTSFEPPALPVKGFFAWLDSKLGSTPTARQVRRARKRAFARKRKAAAKQEAA